MKTQFSKTYELPRALAQYIAQRPRQADNRVHLHSFYHCFADALAGTSEQDLLDVFGAFVHDGWLTADSTGFCITPEGSHWGRTGHLPPLR